MTITNDPEGAAIAQAALALCNESLSQWIDTMRGQAYGPVTVALAARLMPQALELMMGRYFCPETLARIRESAEDLRDACGLDIREEVKPT